MSAFNKILLVVLTVLTFTEAAALNSRYSATISSVIADTTRSIGKRTWPSFHLRTFEATKRSSLTDLANLVNYTGLDDVDKRGISEGNLTQIFLLVNPYVVGKTIEV